MQSEDHAAIRILAKQVDFSICLQNEFQLYIIK